MADDSAATRRDEFAWIDPGVSVWDQWGAAPPPPKVSPARLPAAAPKPNAPIEEPDPAAALVPEATPADPPAAPPPSPAVGGSSDFDPPPADEPDPEPADGPPNFHQFDAELDVAELDERLRPITTWSARGTAVSRSTMSIRSRRMCYQGSLLLIAVHLIDDRPTVLAGRVTACDYDGEGLYAVDLELMPKPESEDVRRWEAQR